MFVRFANRVDPDQLLPKLSDLGILFLSRHFYGQLVFDILELLPYHKHDKEHNQSEVLIRWRIICFVLFLYLL